MSAIPKTGLQLQSIIKSTGVLELRLAQVAVDAPKGDEVLIRVEGAPINPSDLGLLLGPADLSTLARKGDVTTAQVPEQLLEMVAPRLGRAMPVGTEGAGVVLAAGPDSAARALLGKTVAVFGGAMYAQYCTAKRARHSHNGCAAQVYRRKGSLSSSRVVM